MVVESCMEWIPIKLTKNIIRATNSQAVSGCRYGAGIIDLTKAKLEGLDLKTRGLTMYGTKHPKADADTWKKGTWKRRQSKIFPAQNHALCTTSIKKTVFGDLSPFCWF